MAQYWVMTGVQILADPMQGLDTARAAVVATRLAESMGLFTRPRERRVDQGLLAEVLAAAASAGIAEDLVLRRDATNPEDATIRALLAALLASPHPASEIPTLVSIFGFPWLERLAGVSEASLRRYGAESRTTPDDVARRIHFATIVVAILRGSFNEFGIRRWFERAHPALDAHPPADLLKPGFDPDDAGARAILDAAIGLLA